MSFCIIIFIIMMMYKSMIVVEKVFPSSISFLYKLMLEINDNLELLFVVAGINFGIKHNDFSRWDKENILYLETVCVEQSRKVCSMWREWNVCFSAGTFDGTESSGVCARSRALIGQPHLRLLKRRPAPLKTSPEEKLILNASHLLKNNLTCIWLKSSNSVIIKKQHLKKKTLKKIFFSCVKNI